MSEHPSPEDLRRFALGALPRAKFRRVLVHVSGCGECHRAVEPDLAFRPEQVTEDDPVGPGLEYDAAISRAMARALRVGRRIDRERTATFRLVESVRAEDRDLSDLSEKEAERLHGIPMVELLLERSKELRFRDPAGMIQMAELALIAVERIEPRPAENSIVSDLHARVLAELANAYRVADDLFAAEDTLARAIVWAKRGSGEPLLTARIGDLTASLWSDQRRFVEAKEVLDRVYQLYRECGEEHLAGRALISKGLFTGHDNEPRQAILLISEGLALIDPAQEPGLILTAFHEIVLRLVDCGLFRRARLVLWQIQWRYRKDRNRLNLLRLEWLWGKIYTGLEEFDRAEAALQAARRGFQRAEQIYDAALCSLDLAMLWTLQERRAEVKALAREMIATFRKYNIAREAIGVLLLTREWCDQPQISADILYDRFKDVAVLVAELDRGRVRRRRRR